MSSGVSACGFAVAEVFAGHAEIAASRRRRPRHLRAGGLLTEAVTEAVRAASEFVARGGASAAPSLAVPPEPGRPSADAAPAGLRVGPGGGRPAARRADSGHRRLLRPAARRARGLLRQARRLGDCLIVCLNSDASVRALKGPDRPLVAAPDRARVLAALECVDAVIVFDEPTPQETVTDDSSADQAN